MNQFIRQIKYLKTRKKPFQDPLVHHKQICISQTNDKVRILFREYHDSTWKYCITPFIFNSILYTFLKITKQHQLLPFQLQSFLFQVDICLETLTGPQKHLFENLTHTDLISFTASLSSFTSQTFTCHFKILQNQNKKLSFKYKTKFQSTAITEKIIKTTFFVFFLLVDRLKLHQNRLTQVTLSTNSDMYGMRYSIAAFKKSSQKNVNNLPIEIYGELKKEQKQVSKIGEIVTLQRKNLLECVPDFCFTFSQNISKREKLKKKYLESEQEKKKIMRKEKILSNIEIEKEQSMKGFCIQTRFSVITQCSLVFKIIQTHMNRRRDFKKSTQNIEYFNYLVNITKTQSTVCVRKKPLLSLTGKEGEVKGKTKQGSKDQTKEGKEGGKDEIEIKEKSKRILKTEKNCLDIMKESLVTNICPYYVHYKQDDTLYSKMFRISLEEWRQSATHCQDDIILDIFLQIINGLNEMGYHRIIHRDLKPDNILIDDSDPLRPVVKLIDFGSTIYIHEDSEKYQQEVMENFDPRLRTTKPYNMDFNEFRKLCAMYSPQKLTKYTESSYNRHANFDLHSVGKIMEDFLPKIQNQNILANLKFLIALCTCPDPQFRLSLQQTGLFISTVKTFSITL